MRGFLGFAIIFTMKLAMWGYMAYGIPMFTIVYPLSVQKWWGYMATSHAVVTPLLASSLSRLPCCLPLYRWRSSAAAKGGRGAPRREQKVQKVTYLF